MLKYPNCPICKFLKELGVRDQAINDYHESKICFTDFPDDIQVELIAFYNDLNRQ